MVASTALGANSVPAASTQDQAAARQAAAAQSARTVGRTALAYYGAEIERFRKQTWHWQRVMGKPLSPIRTRRLTALTPTAIQRAAAQWEQRSAAAHQRAKRPPHLNQFLCIHRHEGSWTDTGAPYYGGLQMDVGFQQTYGGWLFARKGTANNWSPLEQIWIAEKALKSRGFWPWPNTARFCGLL